MRNNQTSHLRIEFELYKKLQGLEGIPRIYGFHTEAKHNILVMEHLGRSIGRLFKERIASFSLSTTLVLAEQMVY